MWALRKKAVIMILMAFALLCFHPNYAKAQTMARYYLTSSDYFSNLGTYNLLLHWNLKAHGYADTYGYKSAATAYMSYAYTYAKSASQNAFQDYNNGVTSTYYRVYAEYTILNALQNNWASIVSSMTSSDNALDNATKYQYAKQAMDYLYYAISNNGPAIYNAGCEP